MSRRVASARTMVLCLFVTVLSGAPALSQTRHDAGERGGVHARRKPVAPPPPARARPLRRHDAVRRSAPNPPRSGAPPLRVERGGLRYPRRFDLRPQVYRDADGYRVGRPAYDDLRADELERAYQQGVEDGRRLEREERQAERGYSNYQEAMHAGQEAFTSRRYPLAARQFLLAATLNQGDPVARIEAAHAQVALGDFESAVRLLRRAFELERRIVYLPMDIRSVYASVDDFDDHLESVRTAALADAGNAEGWFLLGYYHYFSANMEEASAAFGQATALRPRDSLYAKLRELASLGSRKPASKE